MQFQSQYPNGQILEAAHMIRHCLISLDSLAVAFDRIGMQSAADEIAEMTRLISHLVESIKDNACQSSSDMLRQSQEASSNILLAALAGIKIGSEE